MKKPKLSELTLREKIGQTALVDEWCLLGDYRKTDNPHEYLKKYPCGGLWVKAASNVGDMNFGDGVREGFSEKNYAEKYTKWVDSLNECLPIPLLTGADAETGGDFMFPELTRTFTQAALGAANSKELAYETGVCVASECKYGAINWIWGPILDLSSRFGDTTRTYSIDNMSIIESLAKEQIAGIQSCKVAATAKHFPGPGVLDIRDSHVSTAINHSSFEEWEAGQGALFQSAIDAGVWSMMIGHTSFPAVDNRKTPMDSYLPATLSDKIIIDLLKNKMGFDGVVITDGLGMKSLIMTHPTDRLYVELLKAGNDVILGVKDLKMYFEAVEKAVESGELSIERLDDACRRILDLKEKLGIFDDNKEEYQAVPEAVLERTRALNKKVAMKSIAKVCDKQNLIPLSKDKIKKVVAIYLGHNDDTFNILENILKKAFDKHGATFRLQRYLDEETKHDEHESGEKIAKENDLILYLADLPSGHCASFAGEVWRTAVFSLIHGLEKSAVIALRSPSVYYDYFTFANTVLCTLGISNESLEAVVDALYGEIPFEGKVPMNLFPEYARDDI